MYTVHIAIKSQNSICKTKMKTKAKFLHSVSQCAWSRWACGASKHYTEFHEISANPPNVNVKVSKYKCGIFNLHAIFCQHIIFRMHNKVEELTLCCDIISRSLSLAQSHIIRYKTSDQHSFYPEYLMLRNNITCTRFRSLSLSHTHNEIFGCWGPFSSFVPFYIFVETHFRSITL